MARVNADGIDDWVTQIMDYTGLGYWEALRVTPREFSYINRVHKVRRQREISDIHLLAWKMKEVKNLKGAGKNPKPMFRSLMDFYDNEVEYIRAMYGGEVAESVLEEYQLDGAETMITFNKAVKNREVHEVDEATVRKNIEEQNRRLEEKMKG